MTDQSNDTPRQPTCRSTGRYSDFTPISHFVHGSTRMFALKHRERLRKIAAQANAGKTPAKIEAPIGADEPVERYPDGENVE